MKLAKLYAKQRELDEHIMNEHPELRGKDNLDWKTLALQVELGEIANEWRGFKKWSNDQEPRTTLKCKKCGGKGFIEYPTGVYDMGTLEIQSEPCEECGGFGEIPEINPLLEEYVDYLHFLLSIGNEINYQLTKPKPIKKETIMKQFHEMFYLGADLEWCLGLENPSGKIHALKEKYLNIFEHFLGLGEMLCFTWEQVEQAYFEKNKVNHERQENGY